MNAVEQRTAQNCTFETLHRVYFCDAWRTQPVLGAPESDLVLPPHPGLLTQAVTGRHETQRRRSSPSQMLP